MSECDQNNDLQQLQVKRGQIKASLTRFITFVGKFEATQALQLKLRCDTAGQYLNQFNSVQERIELLDDTELESEERETFENRYYSIIERAKKLICDADEGTTQSSSSENLQTQGVSNINSNTNVRFPVLELPKFFGEYNKWGQFRDMFVALVHNDNFMDNIKKFYYLLSCLKGDAARVVECMEVTSENYNTAWDLLKSRYENKSVIIKNHVRALFEIPTVAKDTHASLRKLTDDVQKHIRSLKTLGEPVESWDTLLIYLITQKLDPPTEKAWEEHVITKNRSSSINSIKFDELIAFLNQRCQLLETINPDRVVNKHDFKNFKAQGSFKKPINNTFAGFTARDMGKTGCPLCQQSHQIYACDKLKSLPIGSRLTEIKNLKLCVNCLRSNHQTAECKARGCKRCNRKHNTMLHIDNYTSPNLESINMVSNIVNESESLETGIQDVNINVNSAVSNHSSVSMKGVADHCNNPESEILLSTAIIFIRDSMDKWHRCRALLDNGSQSNFITNSLFTKLQLSATNTSTPIIGVGNSHAYVNKKVRATIKSMYNDFNVQLSFLVLERITQKLPHSSFQLRGLKMPPGLALADAEFNISNDIDILLGAGIFYNLMCSGQIKLGAGTPILQRTLLGWIISGTVPLGLNTNTNPSTCNLSIVDMSLEKQMEKFWNLEEISSNSLKGRSNGEQDCERVFVDNVHRDETGHFVVKMPIKPNADNLGDSLQNAKKRLYSMERKFNRNPEFKQKYVAFMKDYESLGHMTSISQDELNNGPQNDVFYLPHHGVINESSTTTKLRVVFDGSCKTSTGVSLNDTLRTGPTIQDELFSILLRFRKHDFVITADIEKMYRQVKIVSDQRDLQRIVWRSNPTHEIQHYRLNTVTYGLAPSGYLAIRALHEIAFQQQENYPGACGVILNDFYVDDLITGSDTIENVEKLKQSLGTVLREYGFQLHKWVTNNTHAPNQITNNKHHITREDTKKTLGLMWQPQSDTLSYNVYTPEAEVKKITKRFILSSTSKIFDPLGLVAPAVVQAKLLMQRLWQEGVDWDSTPSPEILVLWSNFIKNVNALNNIQIPRQVVDRGVKQVEFHGFCDASQNAYGACIYVKSGQSGIVRLLCAKSRVAPLKSVTLPRLELCGALLLAQLYQKVAESMKFVEHTVWFWTDSTIVLSWLSVSPHTLKLFVSNRVAEIQNSTDIKNWRHVSSTENPADIVSRGIDPQRLESCRIWWFGPEWLQHDESFWPNKVVVSNNVYEKRKEKRQAERLINHTLHGIMSNSINKPISLVERKKQQWAREREELAGLSAPWGHTKESNQETRNDEKIAPPTVDIFTVRRDSNSSRRPSLPPIYKNPGQCLNQNDKEMGGETSGYGSDNPNNTPEYFHDSGWSARDDRAKWGLGKFWDSQSDAPGWVKRGLQGDVEVIVSNRSPAESPEQDYTEQRPYTQSSTTSLTRTYIRGQNKPVDPVELAERDRKRQLALAHQEAVRQQLEEREKKRREERDRRIREEYEEEQRIEREQEVERKRRDHECQILKEKQDRERKRKEVLQEALELAEKQALEEKSRQKLHHVNMNISENVIDKEKILSFGTLEEPHETQQCQNSKPNTDEYFTNIGACSNININSNNNSTNENMINHYKNNNEIKEVNVNKCPNIPIIHSMSSSGRENVTAAALPPPPPYDALGSTIPYAILLPAFNPLTIPTLDQSPRPRTHNRILTPTQYRRRCCCDSSTQTELEDVAKSDLDQTKDMRYIRDKLVNIELTDDSKRRESKARLNSEKPKWGANRPPTRYVKQSEKDPFYQKKKIRPKMRQIKIYDDRNNYSPHSSDDSQTMSPRIYRKRNRTRALWQKNVQLYQSEIVPLESDRGHLYYKIGECSKCCCECRSESHKYSVDVLKINHSSKEAPEKSNKHRDSLSEFINSNTVEKDVPEKLACLNNDLNIKQEQWGSSPHSPSVNSPRISINKLNS